MIVMSRTPAQHKRREISMGSLIESASAFNFAEGAPSYVHLLDRGPLTVERYICKQPVATFVYRLALLVLC